MKHFFQWSPGEHIFTALLVPTKLREMFHLVAFCVGLHWPTSVREGSPTFVSGYFPCRRTVSTPVATSFLHSELSSHVTYLSQQHLKKTKIFDRMSSPDLFVHLNHPYLATHSTDSESHLDTRDCRAGSSEQAWTTKTTTPSPQSRPLLSALLVVKEFILISINSSTMRNRVTSPIHGVLTSPTRILIPWPFGSKIG